MNQTAKIKQRISYHIDPADGDKLLSSLGKMQIAFMKAFAQYNKEKYLSPIHWNMCIGFWCSRNSEKPLDKDTILEWRFAPDPDTPEKRDHDHSVVGKNKADEHLSQLIRDKFVVEEPHPEINKRKKFYRATEQLYEIMEEVLSVGVDSIKQSFK